MKCKTCGRYFCNDCYKVEKGLKQYLKSPGGQKTARRLMPLLDDLNWDTDEGYKNILSENNVEIFYDSDLGFGLKWQHGVIHIGRYDYETTLKGATLFMSLWLRGVSASMANSLMIGYMNGI